MSMHTYAYHFIRLTFLGMCLIILSPLNVLSNMADPARPGDIVGEPSPTLDSVHVLHEELLIDMRSCADREPVEVTATYRLRNDGSAKELDLVFIAGALQDSTESFSLTLNGASLNGTISDSLPIPLQWNLPISTPGLDWKDSLQYQVYVRSSIEGEGVRDVHELTERPFVFPESTPVIVFSVQLPAGEHTITVVYRADATGYGYSGPVYIWQLGYVLAPVRRWASFGTLEAKVLLPNEWEAATWPQMDRQGDTLFAMWNGIPADAIAISTRMNVSDLMYSIAGTVPLVFALILSLLLTLRLGWKKGVSLKKRGHRYTYAIPLALFCAFLTYLLLGAGVVGADVWQKSLLLNQNTPSYGMMFGFGLLLLSPFVLLLLIPAGITMAAAFLGWRRTPFPLIEESDQVV